MGLSRQEYCSGLPFPSLGGRLHLETESESSKLQADSFPSEPPGKSCNVLLFFRKSKETDS